MDSNVEKGRRLKILRVGAKMTQVALAEELEVKQSFLSDVESGKRPIPDHVIKKACAIFSATEEYFDISKPLPMEKLGQISPLVKINEELKKENEQLKEILFDNQRKMKLFAKKLLEFLKDHYGENKIDTSILEMAIGILKDSEVGYHLMRPGSDSRISEKEYEELINLNKLEERENF